MALESSIIEEMIQDVTPILVTLTQTYYPKLPKRSTNYVEFQDMLHDAIVLSLEIAEDYDLKHDVLLTTWVFACVKRYFINFVQSEYRKLQIPLPPTKALQASPLEEIEHLQLLTSIRMRLTARAREVLDCLLEPPVELVIQVFLRKQSGNANRIWNVDIAEYLDVSQATVSTCIAEISTVLRMLAHDGEMPYEQ